MATNLIKPPKRRSAARQLGAAMMETLGSIGLGAVVLGGVVDQTNRYIDNTKASAAGEQHRLLSEAAKEYLEREQANLGANARVISWTEVKSSSNVAGDLSGTNIYREETCFLARKVGNKIEGILIAKNAAASTEQAADKNLRRSMMINAGNVSMGRMDSANTASRGSVWSKDLSSWNITSRCGGNQTGAVVTNLEMLQLEDRSELLHRKQNTDPTLNTMETAIKMGGKDIENAGTVDANILSGTTINGTTIIGETVTAKTVQLTGPDPTVKSDTNATLTARRNLIFTTGVSDSERMRIASNGNVGIGTANPSAKLHVVGNQKIEGTLTASDGVAVGEDGILSFVSRARQMINLYGSNYGIGVQSFTAYFRSAGGFQFYRGGVHNDGEGNPGGGIALLTIKPNGQVGIGEPNPSTKLDVAGDIKATNMTATGNMTASGIVTADGGFKTAGEVVVDSQRRANFKGGSGAQWDTHFPWSGDGQNYIRGTTNIADKGGNVNMGNGTGTVKINNTLEVTGSATVTGKVSADYLLARATGAVSTNCSTPGELAVHGDIPVFCSPAKKWQRYVGFEIIRRGTTSRPPGDDSVAYSECGSGETLIGGGGECADPTRHYLHFSRAQGTVWGVNCFGRDDAAVDAEAGKDKRAYAYSICLKPSNSITVSTNKTHEDNNSAP